MNKHPELILNFGLKEGEARGGFGRGGQSAIQEGCLFDIVA